MKRIVLTGMLVTGSLCGTAQHTYVPLGADEYQLVDRIETAEKFINYEFSTTLKPLSRRDISLLANEYIEYFQLTINTFPNKIDLHNAERAINISGEWGRPNVMYTDATKRRDRPFLRYFFETEPDFIRHSDEHFFMVLNPVVYTQAGLENNHSDLRYIFLRGAEVRARIADKIGLYAILAENQEKTPNYFTELGQSQTAYPGFDYYTGGAAKKPYDALYARGYIDFPILKDRISATFGYDKNFIGDGFRSMLLGASGAPTTFLRLRGQWKGLSYQSLFTELIDDHAKTGGSRLNKKYASFQYLGFNLGSRVNIGLFESTIFNRHNRMDVFNFIPVIYANTLHRALKNEHQTSLGFTFKAIAAKDLMIYGQAMAQSIDFKTLKDGHWKNQYATQLGLKYTNVFQFTSFDMQLEWNMASPWMYSGMDSITNYTHYNQALAHPLGNGFHEFIAAAFFQPSTKLDLSARVMYSSKAGQDSLGIWNTDLFTPIQQRHQDNGYYLFDHDARTGLYFNLNGSYELMQNMYIDAGVTQMTIGQYDTDRTSTMIYAGFRLNMQRRDYDFW